MAAVMLSNFVYSVVMAAVIYFLNSSNIFWNVVGNSGCVTEDVFKEAISSVLFPV